jgi:hypothetical protein
MRRMTQGNQCLGMQLSHPLTAEAEMLSNLAVESRWKSI